jgi:hypothetical protein
MKYGVSCQELNPSTPDLQANFNFKHQQCDTAIEQASAPCFQLHPSESQSKLQTLVPQTKRTRHTQASKHTLASSVRDVANHGNNFGSSIVYASPSIRFRAISVIRLGRMVSCCCGNLNGDINRLRVWIWQVHVFLKEFSRARSDQAGLSQLLLLGIPFGLFVPHLVESYWSSHLTPISFESHPLRSTDFLAYVLIHIYYTRPT